MVMGMKPRAGRAAAILGLMARPSWMLARVRATEGEAKAVACLQRHLRKCYLPTALSGKAQPSNT